MISEKYRWVKFNGSWHSGKDYFKNHLLGNIPNIISPPLENELIYRDVNDGISLLNVKTLKKQILISSTVLVST